MSLKSSLLVLVVFFVSTLAAQDDHRWNFNIGGGPGFPLGTAGDFAGTGGHFVVGGGPNFGPRFGVNGEFMWHELPIKRSILNQIQVPDGSGRQYSLTFNGMLRPQLRGRMGGYFIGGIGWYHRSGELTAPTIVPGTVCPPFWIWWGVCVSGLFPANAVLASSSSDAFGGNVGGGLTVRIGDGNTKFFTEVRYHHAAHDPGTDLLPLTFGFRW